MRRDLIRYVLLITLILLGSIHLLTYVNDPLDFVSGSYGELRIGESNGFDDVMDRDVPVSAFLSLLSWINSLVMFRFFMVLAGLVSVYFFVVSMRSLGYPDRAAFFMALLVVVNPIFLYSFGGITSAGLAVALCMAGFYALVKESYWMYPLFLAGVLTNFVVGLVVVPVLLLVSIRMFVFGLVSSIVVGSSSLVPLDVVLAGLPFALTDFLVYFDSGVGYGVPFLILSWYGVGLRWERSWKRTLLYVYVLFVFGMSVFYPSVRIVAVILLSVFGGVALLHLIEKEWELANFKALTVLLIVLGVSFSGLVFLTDEVNTVDDERIEAAQFLEDVDGTVLTVERNGHLISYVGNVSVWVDSSSYRYDGYAEKKAVQEEVFQTRNLDVADRLMRNNDIRYVYVDERMRTGEVWSGDDQALLYLIDISSRFTPVFESEHVTVYRYDR